MLGRSCWPLGTSYVDLDTRSSCLLLAAFLDVCRMRRSSSTSSKTSPASKTCTSRASTPSPQTSTCECAPPLRPACQRLGATAWEEHERRLRRARGYRRFEPPDRQHNYTQDVIFDPCRYYEFNCCNDTYGDTEFLEVIAATSEWPEVHPAGWGLQWRLHADLHGARTRLGWRAAETAAEQRFSLSSDGTVLADEYSRRPVSEIFINEVRGWVGGWARAVGALLGNREGRICLLWCGGRRAAVLAPPPCAWWLQKCLGEGDPFPSCIAERVARKESDMYPRCWNFNTSIVADGTCRAPSDGTVMPLCMEVGYTQTAYVVECDNEYRDNAHCGTYLEIHR